MHRACYLLVVIALAARAAAADPAQERALSELATLGPSGLPAACPHAAIGMTASELAAAWPAFQPDEGYVELGANMIMPLFDRAARLNAIVIALSPVLEPAREYVALEKAWGKPAFANAYGELWLWPAHHLRGTATRDTSTVIEAYVPLAELDVARSLSIGGMTVAQAEHRLGVTTEDSGEDITFDLATSEYGGVMVYAHVAHSKIEHVSLHVDYPPGALPRVLAALHAYGPFTRDPHAPDHWRGKRLALDASEVDDFAILTITRVP